VAIKKGISFSILVVIALVLAILYLHFRQDLVGVKVTVINESDGTFSTITAHFSGGIKVLGSLRPGEKKSLLINPRGESSLTLEYQDPVLKTHRELIDVYFENGYGGKLIIWLEKSGGIRWKNDIQI